jgi:hypothetical protein
MSMRANRRAAIGFGALVIVLTATFLLYLGDDELIAIPILGVWLTTTAGVGALVLAKRPDNAVGGLMLGGALGVATGLLVEAYASFVYEFGHPGWPLGELAAWLTLWISVPAFGLFIHVFLRFPTGKLPSPGWRWVSGIATTGIVVSAIAHALRPGPIDNVPVINNPLGSIAPEPLLEVGAFVGETLLIISGLAAVLSLFVRYRNAAQTERQQMKWFVFASSLFPVLFLISQLVQVIETSEEQFLGFLIIVAALLFVPVSMGIGILRHRLYDIDLVLNRALVYASITAILAAIYFGAVVLLQQALEPLTKQSDLAIAGSTLAVAALFRPLRTRIQGFIDKRFYRRKYDAAATLNAFSIRLRDQVDIDSLSRDVVDVVGATMQPAHASLWLRPEEGSL